MGSNGGPRGWAFLRRNPALGAAWRARFGNPEFEAAPFPVRIRSMADRQALAWGQLAREDAHKTDGPASPFWAAAPMLDGERATGAPSLLEFLAGSGARLEGLRLADGSLILKIENGSQAVQVRIGPESDTGMDAGPDPVLSQREKDVLVRCGRHRDKQVAAQLGLTVYGVRYHLRKIFSKLGAANRTEAVRLARELGLIGDDS